MFCSWYHIRPDIDYINTLNIKILKNKECIWISRCPLLSIRNGMSNSTDSNIMANLTLLVRAPEYSGAAMHSRGDERRNIPALTLWANTAYSPTDYEVISQ